MRILVRKPTSHRLFRRQGGFEHKKKHWGFSSVIVHILTGISIPTPRLISTCHVNVGQQHSPIRFSERSFWIPATHQVFRSRYTSAYHRVYAFWVKCFEAISSSGMKLDQDIFEDTSPSSMTSWNRSLLLAPWLQRRVTLDLLPKHCSST